ncbi:MAG: PfkB family carbohydrate kinase, partial [Chloroflexota bacterium]
HFYTEGTSAPAVLGGPLAAGLPAGTRALLTGTLGLVLEPMATTLEALAVGLPDDVLLMVDPNARPSVIPDADAWRERIVRVLPRADVVKASAEDLEYLRPGEPIEGAAAWVAAHGPQVVLVTDGARPVTVLAGGAVHRVESPPVEVVDTVGAGDTFGGAFLACFVHDGGTRADLADADRVLRAVRFAVRASAAVCARPGANPPTLADLGGWPAS